MRIQVAINERVVVVRDGVPKRVLGPGSYWFWSRVTSFRYDTNALILDAPHEVRQMMPGEWYEEIHLAPHQRALLYRDEKPVRFLRPGIHRYWTVDPSVRLSVMSVDDEVPELTAEAATLVPRDEIVDVTVNQHQRGLLYVQGRFERMLEAGRYVFWSHPKAKVVVTLLDMRHQIITIAGQELMTSDKVSLRLTLTCEYAPADPPVLLHAVANVHDALYLMVQLAAREFVAGVSLDELLEGRNALADHLESQVVPRAAEVGVAVHSVGVKDVILPGDMKLLLNRVIEADKQAAANVILRREEAQATRTMANTAKVIADNPVLMRLKELDAMRDIAERINEVKLIVGGKGLEQLLGSDKLLGSGDTSE
jgi:hypothetical protein